MRYIKQDYILICLGVFMLLLSACCPSTRATKDITLAQKCNASPSCKAALDKLSTDVK